MTNEAKIQKDCINFGFCETPDLAERIPRALNRSQNQCMVKRHYQRPMSHSSQHSAEPYSLATIAQGTPFDADTRR